MCVSQFGFFLLRSALVGMRDRLTSGPGGGNANICPFFVCVSLDRRRRIKKGIVVCSSRVSARGRRRRIGGESGGGARRKKKKSG